MLCEARADGGRRRYHGEHDSEPAPVGTVASFEKGVFIDVVQASVDSPWWIARILGQGPQCVLIPSPAAVLTKTTPRERRSLVKGRLSSAGQRDLGRRGSIGSGILGILSVGRTPSTAPTITKLESAKNPYELAPRIRPVVLLGPSKLRAPVTEKMQRALLTYLQMSFEGQTTLIRSVSGGKASSGDEFLAD